MIKRVIALLKLKIKWKTRNQHNMTYLTNLCDIEQIRVGRYTYGPICVETFGCENTKLIIGQFCSVAQNVRLFCGDSIVCIVFHHILFRRIFKKKKVRLRQKEILL